MSIRADILAGLRAAEPDPVGDETPDELLAAYRAEIERELLGNEANPSSLVLNANSYRLLVERIEATIVNPSHWDGDDAEVEILARYVEWLAAGSPMEDGWPVRVEGGAR